MNIFYKDSGWKTDFTKLIKDAVQKSLTEAATIVEATAVTLAPYKTGTLRNSITKKVGNEYAIVGTNLDYAIYVEYGTAKMSARPFMRPALDNNRNRIVKIFKKNIRS